MLGLALNALGWVFRTTIKNRDIFIKIALAVSLVIAFKSLFNLVTSFITRAYNEIMNGLNTLANQSLPDGLGCVMSNFGLDQFLTSAFAIFVSTAVFWGISVLSILSYRAAMKLINIKFKAH